MTKEEQRKSAERIMEKTGPLTYEELAAYARLATPVEEYPQGRACLECGEEFAKEDIFLHADHLASHYPSMAQWVTAHQMILQGKERAKHSQAPQP